VLLLSGGTATQGLDTPEDGGIRNYSRVEQSQGFAGTTAGFGGVTPPEAMNWLAEQGFATVISLRLEEEDGVDIPANRAAAIAAGLDYVHLPLDSANPDPAVIEQYMSIASDPGRQPVYLYCGSATRAAAVWMIGRVSRDGLTLEEAAAEAGEIAERPEDAIGFAEAYLSAEGG
jgi:uncharacterized protein (TIGR01244 family)